MVRLTVSQRAYRQSRQIKLKAVYKTDLARQRHLLLRRRRHCHRHCGEAGAREYEKCDLTGKLDLDSEEEEEEEEETLHN